MPVQIKPIDECDPAWPQLLELVRDAGQQEWLSLRLDFHLDSQVLAAWDRGEIVGFLRFVRQPIGPDMDCPALELKGRVLVEAKVLAFGVAERQRGRGIGYALQQALISTARKLDCYQVRSHSSGSCRANHHLKLKMGFAVQPVRRGNDRRGVYFILPLATSR